MGNTAVGVTLAHPYQNLTNRKYLKSPVAHGSLQKRAKVTDPIEVRDPDNLMAGGTPTTNGSMAAEAVVRWTGHPILETCHYDRYHTVPVTGQFSAEINVFITHP
ncbi:hypothetical protein [Acidithiobacillus sulfurivorans]|uniref:Aldehyde oxidase/xanthine dehydrogenase second molybdopterin binding domain-containing protein n=1 Tax=Acidithiobacillus sulfurivorans TaxID=1958756 RepID=A0ABS6A2Q1_9PROT|nr:hypothetical protein [Acidithiobacillus sulfurivorans]MBU2761801.1 hypothetical protein [Acidithiobacillus sulfurivorans]